MASAIQNDADNLEAALSLLDEYVTHDRDSIREENSFNDYHEIADLCNEVKCTVEQLETEGFNRTLFLSHLPPETISFFASLFARSQKDEYIYKLEEKLKQTENELKEMIEKRNHLELERIQLLDKVAELQIQLARVHQQDAKSEQNGPRRILPLQTSSPLGPVSTSKSPMNRALLSPDEGIEGTSLHSDSRPSSRSSSSSCPFSPSRSVNHLTTPRFKIEPERKGPKALSTPNLNDFETNSGTSGSSFERSKNNKSLRKIFSSIRLRAGDMKSPKISRAIPHCGQPAGLELSSGSVRTWGQTETISWLKELGLGAYSTRIQNGECLLGDPEKSLGMSNPFHQKKLRLALRGLNNPEPGSELDVMWVCSWLDDIGLPEYKKAFHDNLIDGRMVNLLTIDELMSLGISSQLHYLSIKRGIEVLRMNDFNRGTMVSRPSYDGKAEPVERWSLFRIMEWLRSIELAEFATNLRGTGVHGGLIALEPGFGGEHFATLLQMSQKKTLLRKHLHNNFEMLLDDEQQQSKKDFIVRLGMPMPLTARLKRRKKQSGFSLAGRRSSNSNKDDELVCPLNLGKRRPSISIMPPDS